MRVVFLYERYYDILLKQITIGGIQTYISTLADTLMCDGYECIVLQCGQKSDCSILSNGLRIITVPVDNNAKIYEKSKKLVAEAEHIGNVKDDILLFASDVMVCAHSFKKSLAIQHGIYWDIPLSIEKYDFALIFYLLKKAKEFYKIIQRLKYVNRMVCVDYNYVNWLRAVTQSPKLIDVIPNFTHIPDECLKSENGVKIIFARRFEQYRGTRVFTKAIKRLLDEGHNIDVTIAGNGTDETWMRTQLEGYQTVHFIQYASTESLLVHRDKHIAVVPTIGSEGTSLSLLEAMASKCAVVCTYVGGMTNIVIDQVNGLMVKPCEQDIYKAIKTLLENVCLRNELAESGYETVKKGFSTDKWQGSWRAIIREM